MLKKLKSLLSRETAQWIPEGSIPAQAPAVHLEEVPDIQLEEVPLPFSSLSACPDEETLFLEKALGYMWCEPISREMEREMSDETVARLGDAAPSLLPKIHDMLQHSDWTVIWEGGQMSFIHKPRLLARYDHLLQMIVELEELPEDPWMGSTLSAICTSFAELHEQLVRLLDPIHDRKLPTLADVFGVAITSGYRISEVEDASIKAGYRVTYPKALFTNADVADYLSKHTRAKIQ